MPNNDFSKEERIAWEDVGPAFEDYLVLSQNVTTFETDQTTMERAGDVIRRPVPYIATTTRGTDQTGNFKPITQMTVPATIDIEISSTWSMTATELRDDLQNERFGKAAAQKLASDVNWEVLQAAALKGTMVVTKSTAASEFGDVSLLETIMNDTGVPMQDRFLAYSTRDYNGLARDLANRANLNQGKTLTAYEKAYVGEVASFKTFKLDTKYSLPAALGGAGLTVNTLTATANYYIPKATSALVGGQRNVDNRFQLLTVSSTINVAAGDAFTIAGVYSVHQISKQNTGSLKTFRVISVESATTMVISPPIIAAQGGSQPELMYKNCVITTESATSAIVFLNTTLAAANPFWYMDAIEILPGRYAVPTDAGAGVLKMTTKNKIEITMAKQFDIKTYLTEYRMDIRFGICVKAPEMIGIELFGQV